MTDNNCGNLFTSKKFDLKFEPVDEKDGDMFIVDEMSDGFSVKYISIEPEPESPRDFENLGTMVCFHNKYNLGDNEHCYKRNDFNSFEHLKSIIEEREDVGAILPLYLYDHSGITMRTVPFDDRWDSSKVGFIFVSKDKIRKEFEIDCADDNISEDILDVVKKVLEGEVEIYDSYIKGDVYRLVKETFDKDGESKDCDICGSYYDIKSAKEELKTF